MVANSLQGKGARRQDERLPLRERLRWLTRSLSLLALVSVVAGLLWGGDRLFQKLDVPIGVIGVKGEFTHVDQRDVQAMVEPLINGGILSLNLAKIRHQLELDPWIEQVAVSRQWPGGLVINVVEEVAIARWGGHGFLNSRGEMLEIGDNSDLMHLPLLQGEVHTERSLMKAYREVAQLLQPSNLKIVALKRDVRGAWWLSLENGLELVVGRGQVMEKMRRFLVVWELALKTQVERIARVDIRYDNGVAVQWAEKVSAVQPKEISVLIVAPGLPGQA
ncbi:MAG: cell division protein FtsQ/DivIB [Porticoccus sp.]|nr:cell division protein FtsQ/DivIB [Porticoccus sp.]MBQ0807724.1 cell division protein FtsQ/DivIB [Porticoccus sp.]